jgi:hypothetical protein
MVINVGIRRRCGSQCEAVIGGIRELIASKAAASLDAPRVVVEVGVAAADSAPVKDALIIHVGVLGKQPIQRDRLTRTGGEEPRHAIGQPIRMAGPTATPSIAGLLAPEVQRHDVADRRVEEPIIRDTDGGEEG